MHTFFFHWLETHHVQVTIFYSRMSVNYHLIGTGPFHVVVPVANICPKSIKSEMRSFKSNENIHKTEGGSYYVVSANKASSVTL